MKSAVRRLLAACLLAASVLLVAAPSGTAAPARPASPDDCVKADADAAEAADAVFTGVVTDVRRNGGGPGEALFTNTTQVDLVYKGPIETTTVAVVTRSMKDPTGLGPLKSGERYLFFARTLDGTSVPAYAAGGCSGTSVAVAEQVTQIEELLGEGRPAVPPPTPEASFERVTDAEPADFTRSAAPGLALVLIGLLGLVVVRRLGRRSA